MPPVGKRDNLTLKQKLKADEKQKRKSSRQIVFSYTFFCGTTKIAIAVAVCGVQLVFIVVV